MKAYERCHHRHQHASGPRGTSSRPTTSGSARSLVARIVTRTIESLDLRYPEVTDEQKAVIAEARKQLEAEGA